MCQVFLLLLWYLWVYFSSQSQVIVRRCGEATVVGAGITSHPQPRVERNECVHVACFLVYVQLGFSTLA